MAVPYTRTKVLTNTSYSPDNPTTPRQDIDGAVQEVYDMLNSTVDGSSGAEYVKSAAISGVVGDNIHDQVASVKTQLNNIALGQVPPGTPLYFLRTKSDGSGVEWVAIPPTDLIPLWNEIYRTRKNELSQMLLNSGINDFDNVYGDAFDASSGINSGLSTNYVYDSTNKSVKVIRDVISVMTADNAPSPFVASASTTLSGGHNPYTAFDNNQSTSWGTNGVLTGWLKIDCGTSKNINGYTLQAPDLATRAPKTWAIEGSNTGAFSGEQTTLDTQTNITTWVAFETKTFPATLGNFRYYRINITAVNGATDNVQIARWQLLSSDVTGTVYLNTKTSTSVLTKVIMEALYTGTIAVSLSRDGGTTFTSCTLDTLTDISSQPSGTSVVAKIVLTGDAELKGISYGGVTT